ncbi:MAG: LytTR family DNA-binding domain-containing protein [Vagococcus sp.]
MKVILNIDEKYEDTEIMIQTNAMSSEIEHIVRICDNYNNKPIFGVDSTALIPLKIEKVIRFFTSDKKVYCELNDRTLLVKHPLYQLEHSFQTLIRISNSELINPDYIEELELSFSGTIKIMLSNGSDTYSSRRYMKELKRRLGI